jgi:antitoxin component YwqK of YwqJK toxin-antitoxin module
MKNILFPILIILCSCNGFKDETVKRYKESEIKEESKNFWVSIETGEALTGIVYRKEGNSNGDTTTYERNFKNGKILSLKSFNKDGSLLGETFYENGLISKSWSEIGVYRDEQTFKKGKLILENDILMGNWNQPLMVQLDYFSILTEVKKMGHLKILCVEDGNKHVLKNMKTGN